MNKKNVSRHIRRVEGATVRHAHRFIIGRWDNIRDVRRHIFVWLVGIALLITLVGVQMIWLQRNYVTSAPVAGGVYAEAVNGPADTLNPLYAVSTAETATSKLLFSSLFDYDTSGHLRGDLARNLTMNPNQLEYTVTLKPNIKWHDGETVGINDVLFTINLMKNPAARAVSSLRAAWENITVTPLGQNAIKFTLPNPNAAFRHALTFAVLPEHVLKDIQPTMLRENTFSTHPIGSGPFEIRRLQQVNTAEGRKIVHMSAFDGYYKGQPKLNRFQLHVYGSTDAILNALRTNEVNAAADIDSLDVSKIDQAHYSILAKPVNSGVYALLNTTAPLLQDKAVRQALQSVTNTDAIRKELGGDRQPIYLPFANGQLLDGDIPAAPLYNPQAAATQLDAAGWVLQGGKRFKNGQPLKLRLVTVTEEAYQRAIEELSNQWRKLGIETEVTIINPEDATQDLTQTLKNRDYDVLINRLIIGADPDVYAYWHSSQASELGKNYSNYSNSISDTALSGALNNADRSLRDVRYKAFARQWLSDVPAIGLYQANMYYVHSKKSNTILKDEKITTPVHRYGNVVYWTVDQGMVYKTP